MSDRVMRVVAIIFLLAGCGHSPAAPTTQASTTTGACDAARVAILDAIGLSRTRACASAEECITVTSPSHPDRELAEVVHRDDAAALDARAIAHLEACGAWAHHEAIDAVRVIEPSCVDRRCAATETVLHIEE